MRNWINLCEAIHGVSLSGGEPTEPYIDAHRSGENIVEIEMMWIPADQRGGGVGRATYLKWEGKLPPEIHLVRIWAADTGAGPSDGFWRAMGFEYRWVAEEPETLGDSAAWMQKGVNGHPTPAPMWVEPDEDSEDDA